MDGGGASGTVRVRQRVLDSEMSRHLLLLATHPSPTLSEVKIPKRAVQPEVETFAHLRASPVGFFGLRQ